MHDKPIGILAQLSPSGHQTLDRYIRLLGCSILVVLIVAYATGEEFPHTHQMIGYGIAVLLVAAVVWEIIKLRGHAPLARSPDETNEVLLSDGLQTAAIGLLIILPLLALLAASALIIMLVTHNYWGTTLVDEMHEVVAYFGLGLLAFYLASLVVTGVASMRP